MPLGVWVARVPGDAVGGRLSIRGGALLGALYFGLVFHWVPVALVVADPGIGSALFALAAYGLIVVGLAALTAVSVRLLHHAVHALGAPLWLALAVTWTAMEWSRAHLPDSLSLPWLGLGTSLTAYPELVGIAEIVGARGVTFWLAAVNGLLAMLWLRRAADGRDAGRSRALLAGCAALAVGVPAAWGVWRASALRTRPVADVAIIQPNAQGRAKVPPEPAPLADPTVRLPPPDAVRGGGASGSGAPPDLVVLPELFLRAVPGSPDASTAVDGLMEYSRRVGAPVLFGGLGAEGAEATRPGDADATGPGGAAVDPPSPGPAPVRYNSVFLVSADGLTDFRYDKRHLVPVVERIPLLVRGPRGSDPYAAGAGRPLAEVGDVRYGVLICYESSYPEAARSLRRAGADVLVNVTNDAWFGAEPWYARTTALWQHPAHLVMRAVEGRVGVVRSANTGISFFVDPVGRRHEVTGLFTDDVRRHRVRSTDLTTLYVRLGDVVGGASAVVAFGLLLLVVALPERAVRVRRGPPSLDP